MGRVFSLISCTIHNSFEQPLQPVRSCCPSLPDPWPALKRNTHTYIMHIYIYTHPHTETHTHTYKIHQYTYKIKGICSSPPLATMSCHMHMRDWCAMKVSRLLALCKQGLQIHKRQMSKSDPNQIRIFATVVPCWRTILQLFKVLPGRPMRNAKCFSQGFSHSP